MSGCPDKVVLAAFAANELGGPEAERVEAHLEQCGRCAQRVACSRGGDDLIAEIRELEASRSRLRGVMCKLEEVEKRTTTMLFDERRAGDPEWQAE